ncbi:hypothetical protein Bca52824_057579 [Brassica carinata]|uniref:Ubiquitin-like protease family profile domain-containing protein n=1 Tax=Brassica carinata TaxID=52824 RepID=A0A8X7UDX8_BRACI|nr:hypothetical protein Bca52824_057579 [Brassica carinata]
MHIEVGLELLKRRKINNPDLLLNKTALVFGVKFLENIDELYDEFLGDKEGFQFGTGFDKYNIEKKINFLYSAIAVEEKYWVGVVVNLEKRSITAFNCAAMKFTDASLVPYINAYAMALPFMIRNFFKDVSMDTSMFSIKIVSESFSQREFGNNAATPIRSAQESPSNTLVLESNDDDTVNDNATKITSSRESHSNTSVLEATETEKQNHETVDGVELPLPHESDDMMDDVATPIIDPQEIPRGETMSKSDDKISFPKRISEPGTNGGVLDRINKRSNLKLVGKKGLWFSFGEQLMRFSLRKFHLVTGLPCVVDKNEEERLRLGATILVEGILMASNPVTSIPEEHLLRARNFKEDDEIQFPLCLHWIETKLLTIEEVDVKCILGDPELHSDLVEDVDSEFGRVVHLVKRGYRLKRQDWLNGSVDIAVAEAEVDENNSAPGIYATDQEKIEFLTKKVVSLEEKVKYLEGLLNICGETLKVNYFLYLFREVGDTKVLQNYIDAKRQEIPKVIVKKKGVRPPREVDHQVEDDTEVEHGAKESDTTKFNEEPNVDTSKSKRQKKQEDSAGDVIGRVLEDLKKAD